MLWMTLWSLRSAFFCLFFFQGIGKSLIPEQFMYLFIRLLISYNTGHIHTDPLACHTPGG